MGVAGGAGRGRGVVGHFPSGAERGTGGGDRGPGTGDREEDGDVARPAGEWGLRAVGAERGAEPDPRRATATLLRRPLHMGKLRPIAISAPSGVPAVARGGGCVVRALGVGEGPWGTELALSDAGVRKWTHVLLPSSEALCPEERPQSPWCHQPCADAGGLGDPEQPRDKSLLTVQPVLAPNKG
jgi:hypothetical protein